MVSRATCSRLVYDLEVVELEQCGVRLENLQLLKEHAANAWRTHLQQLEHGGDDDWGLSAHGAQDADDRDDVFIIHAQVAVPLLRHGVSSEELSVLKVV